jgi:hypothetical protein
VVHQPRHICQQTGHLVCVFIYSASSQASDLKQLSSFLAIRVAATSLCKPKRQSVN